MFQLYPRLILAWEQRLAARDTDRQILPFEWGLEWLGIAGNAGDPRQLLREYVQAATARSDEFFSYRPPSDYLLSDGVLTFTSPLASPYPENNRVYADFFPARQDQGRAVLVLPQWNADQAGHVGLCRLLNRFGLTALRLSLAYHDRRRPAGCRRADFHVSANLGRTIHACRQSVIDARACLDWLERRGYRRLGILGTSLGSCIAFIAAAHDERVRAGVFNHVSMYFGDVVWTGLATRCVRQGLADAVSQDELRDYWRIISPATHVRRAARRPLRSLLIWARYDTTFLPEYSKQFLTLMFQEGCRFQTACLPCGHYTTGQFPFNIMDGWRMCRFLASTL